MPGKPECRHITQASHNLGEQMTVLDGLPHALILGSNDRSHEPPGRTEYGKDKEVVEHKERIEASSDMAFSGCLRYISRVREQSSKLKLGISCQLTGQVRFAAILTTTGTPIYIRVCTKGAKIPCAIAQPVG